MHKRLFILLYSRYENQSSAEIFLVAGKYYYLEAIHKGVDASDSLSVGVRMPTGRYQRPISKENLQWRLPGNIQNIAFPISHENRKTLLLTGVNFRSHKKHSCACVSAKSIQFRIFTLKWKIKVEQEWIML